jgi:hypothetical protein
MTRRNFQDLLNEYLPNQMLKEELIRRDYILTKVNKDNNWKGSKLIVPFKGAGASSVKFGQLTDSSDIAQSVYVRGSIDDYREVWGSLIFNQRDLQEHDGKIPESTFLRLLPDELEDFMEYKKEVVSIQLGTGPHFATLTANGTAGGVITVDKIDRFQVDQKVVLQDDDTAAADYYVLNVNVNTLEVTLSASRGGAAADVSTYTTAQSAKCYHDGVLDSGTFTSMRDALLSAANGGDTKIHGVDKTKYGILQSVNVDGTSITASNILDKLFDAYTEVRTRAKGMATEYIMSYKHLGSILKLLESQKGQYRVTSDPKVNVYGWTEVGITSVKGDLKFVGIQEMDDDVIPLVDWRSITFRSNGFFRKRISPDGREYFEIRNTQGYQYVVDCLLFGEMEYRKPGHSAIIHSINY